MKSRLSMSGLVYATDLGRMCPGCREAISLCACSDLASTTRASDGIVRVSRMTKGRGGKAVTVVCGLSLDPASMEKMAKQLKAACDSGGTVKNDVVEVQGDHLDKVFTFLVA